MPVPINRPGNGGPKKPAPPPIKNNEDFDFPDFDDEDYEQPTPQKSKGLPVLNQSPTKRVPRAPQPPAPKKTERPSPTGTNPFDDEDAFTEIAPSENSFDEYFDDENDADDSFVEMQPEDEVEDFDEPVVKQPRAKRKPRTVSPPPPPSYMTEEDDDDEDYEDFDSNPSDYDDSDFDEDEDEPTVPAKSNGKLKSRKESKPKEEKPSRRFAKPSLKKSTGTIEPKYTEDTFIDEKKLKLKVFGRKESVNTSEYDHRQNMRRKARFVQVAVVGLFAVLALAGLKNAIIPPPKMTDAEVETIVATTVGDTGFPMERGKGFSEDFMRAYLTVDYNDQIARRALGFFYTGSLSGTAPELNRTASSNFTQKVIYGPTLYKAVATTPETATFVYGALVQAESTQFKAPEDGSSAKWSFFNVNVYYNEAAGTMIVTSESPSIVPPDEVGSLGSVPKAQELGTPVSREIQDAIAPTVYGFIKGYAAASVRDHKEIDQYIIPDPPLSLKQGMDGRYTLSGNDSQDIRYTAYQSEPGVLKVRTLVNWIDSVGPRVSANYTSTYVITLQLQTNGKYLVSRIAPLTYLPATVE